MSFCQCCTTENVSFLFCCPLNVTHRTAFLLNSPFLEESQMTTSHPIPPGMLAEWVQFLMLHLLPLLMCFRLPEWPVFCLCCLLGSTRLLMLKISLLTGALYGPIQVSFLPHRLIVVPPVLGAAFPHLKVSCPGTFKYENQSQFLLIEGER